MHPCKGCYHATQSAPSTAVGPTLKPAEHAHDVAELMYELSEQQKRWLGRPSHPLLQITSQLSGL